MEDTFKKLNEVSIETSMAFDEFNDAVIKLIIYEMTKKAAKYSNRALKYRLLRNYNINKTIAILKEIDKMSNEFLKDKD